MSKIYSIDSTNKSTARECRPFEAQKQDVINECSTYSEVLNILKEAFKMVDFKKILNR